jgi:hypothetical protein
MKSPARIITIATVIAATAFVVSIRPPVTSAQTLQTKSIMQQKLAESQQLLAAVVTSNWIELDRHTRAIQMLTNNPGWDVLHMPEYHDQTVAFQKALGNLLDAANQRDQRMAAAAYSGLVTSCVECHRYVARARIAAIVAAPERGK